MIDHIAMVSRNSKAKGKVVKALDLQLKKEQRKIRQEKFLQSLSARSAEDEVLKLVKSVRNNIQLSIAFPASILDNAQSAELRTYLIGQLARAACIFRVAEIVVFNNDSATNPPSSSLTQMVKVLEYLECPQYLRKRFFPLSADLRFAGLLNPLDCGHHLRGDNREALYREGVVLAEDDEMLEGEGAAPEGKSYVYVGLPQKVLVNYAVMPNVRVTVKLLDNDGRRGKLVSPGEPTKETGSYWGYRVRAAESLKEVLKGAKYDVKIGTSDKGECCETAWKRLKWETNKKGSAVASCRVIMVFGGLSGLEAAVSSDTDSVASLFDVYVNTCSNQGSRTIRTEEAILISLAKLEAFLATA